MKATSTVPIWYRDLTTRLIRESFRCSWAEDAWWEYCRDRSSFKTERGLQFTAGFLAGYDHKGPRGKELPSPPKPSKTWRDGFSAGRKEYEAQHRPPPRSSRVYAADEFSSSAGYGGWGHDE